MTIDPDYLLVSNLQFSPAPMCQHRFGMLGFVTVDLDDRFRLAGLMLRRTRRGQLALSFPKREDPTGEDQFFFRPLHDQARVAFEQDVFDWLPRHALEGRR